MSLALIQGYSSAEEEEEPMPENFDNSSDDDQADDVDGTSRLPIPVSYKSGFDDLVTTVAGSSSGLPSALTAFSEISGPPQFLNNCVEEHANSRDVDHPQGRHGRWRTRKEKKDTPAGAVVEARAQLVGIHERIRSDIEVNQPSKSSVPSTIQDGGKRMPTATNPNAEDAAELLRMCLQCGVPKTFSSAKGMVCPICGDRPSSDADNESKKKGSTIKDKERSKRMKGQSSHATWKSETEMLLRQQFD